MSVLKSDIWCFFLELISKQCKVIYGQCHIKSSSENFYLAKLNLPFLKYAATISKHSKTANRLPIAEKFVSENLLSVFKNIEKRNIFRFRLL